MQRSEIYKRKTTPPPEGLWIVFVEKVVEEDHRIEAGYKTTSLITEQYFSEYGQMMDFIGATQSEDYSRIHIERVEDAEGNRVPT